MRQENNILRTAISTIASYVGGYAASTCSVEFLTSSAPEEVRLKIKELELRIDALEVENKKLKQPQWFNYVEDWDRFGCNLYELHEEIDAPPFSIIETNGVRDLWFFHDGTRCHSFDNKEDATKAAEKAREINRIEGQLNLLTEQHNQQ